MGVMHKRITLPLSTEILNVLRAGENLLLDGKLYVARDAAHRKMVEAIARSEPLPFELSGETIYYMGPTPAKPGCVIGAAGPTTSSRMDGYTLPLIAAGLRGMIGKGRRSPEVKDAIQTYGAVYFATIGGAGALLSKQIIRDDVVAFGDLGPEAVRRIEVVNFPVIVANDVFGGDLFLEGQKRYRAE
jgi:fumarate hydratase subunit beta